MLLSSELPSAFSSSPPIESTDHHSFSDSFRTKTDEQGAFSLDSLSPGEGGLVRLIETSRDSWSHSHRADVVVESGRTTYVTLGDAGAMIRGHVRLDSLPGQNEKLTILGNAFTMMPSPGRSFNSADEAQAFYNSPEWRARAKKQKQYTMIVGMDGFYTLDSVAPGNYRLNIRAAVPKVGGRSWETTILAQAQTEFTVPENPDPQQPIILDEIVLVPLPAVNSGPSGR